MRGSRTHRRCGRRTGSVLLAVDGGATRTRCVAYDVGTRTPIANGMGGPCNPFAVGMAAARRALGDALRATLEAGRLPRGAVAGICAGLAGLELDGTGLRESLALIGSTRLPLLGVHSDLVIAHCAAFGGDSGVIVVAGTGSAVLGIDEGGHRFSADGWGPILGDEGSGYWVGAESLRAAARHCDGRGPPTTLTELLCRRFRVPRFSCVLPVVYSWDSDTLLRVAGLAEITEAAAAAGDPVSERILARAADHLVASVEAVVEKMRTSRSRVRVSYGGGLLRHGRVLRERFGRRIRARYAARSLVAPRDEPVHGAFLLGLRAILTPGRNGETGGRAIDPVP